MAQVDSLKLKVRVLRVKVKLLRLIGDAVFNEQEHPRRPAGKGGGQFTAAGGGGGGGGRRETRATLHKEIRSLGASARANATLAQLREQINQMRRPVAPKSQVVPAPNSENRSNKKKKELISELRQKVGGSKPLKALKDKGFVTTKKSIHAFTKQELADALKFLEKPEKPVSQASKAETGLTPVQVAVKEVQEVFKHMAADITIGDFQAIKGHYDFNDLALVKIFNDNIKIKPDRFVKIMTNNLETEAVRLYLTGRQCFQLNCAFKGGGSVRLEFNFVNKTVDFSFLELPRSAQGAGIAKKLLASQIEAYKHIGIEKVPIHANIDVGSYAWAKYGFVPKQNSWNTFREEMQDKLQDNTALRNLRPDVKARIDVILSSDNPKAIWALADLPDQIRRKSVSKRLMMNEHWYANLELNDTEAMRRFDNYVGK